MVKIAIIEDSQIDREALKRTLQRFSTREGLEIVVDEFESAVQFFMKYQPVYDLIFMDIDMPQMNGMEAAQRLRRLDKRVLLVFVTNMAQYAIKGYEVDAIDFILKPIDEYSFALKLQRVLARLPKNRIGSFLIHTDTLESIAIQTSSIKYVEVNGHYVIYHTCDGVYKQYATLKSVENRLGEGSFVKCNRCFLVNLSYVDSIQKDEVLIGKERLVISRPQKKAFLSAFSDYIGGRKE